ncbi:MAG: cation:proton antiporter [Pseudonocardiaceae bacterium]
MLLATRLVLTLCVAGLGCAFAFTVGLHGVETSSDYFLLVTVLLAVGLFSCMYDIAINEVRRNARVVLVAVTLGVLVKAALIAGVMYLVFRDPAYIVLGVAVAQIDPLSVAIMRNRSRLSERAKTILSAWSAFDDPVTAILAIYLSALAINLGVGQSAAGPGAAEISGVTSVASGVSALGEGLLGNALLVAAGVVVWALLWWVSKRTGRSITDGAGPHSRGLQAAAILALAVGLAVAVNNFWMLGLAVVALFFRPGIGPVLQRVTPVAFLLAIFALGLVLAEGVNLVPGLVLGLAAFGAQVVVGLLVTRSLPSGDRVRLAFGQQSGITAVILALLLETVFPGTVAVVAPAILVVNTLHLASNVLLDKIEDRVEEHPDTILIVTEKLPTSSPVSNHVDHHSSVASRAFKELTQETMSNSSPNWPRIAMNSLNDNDERSSTRTPSCSTEW